MSVSLRKAIEAMDESMTQQITPNSDPVTYNLCLALKGIAEALVRIETDLDGLRRALQEAPQF